MGALKRVVDLLRQLVKNKKWDYCVIWKLGDDPSSFIKWVDCCCGGGVAYGHNIMKEESSADVQQHIFPIYKDVHFPHLAKTKACETLAQYPSSMPLYFGLKSEVPDFNIDGSPTSSTPSYGHPLLLSCSTHGSPKKSTGNSSKSWKLNSKMDLSMKKETKASLVCSKRALDWKNKTKARQRTGNELYQSKNVFIERNRRQRIKDGLFTLRALVPKISKMDRASILADAIDYIVDLQKMIVCFQTELKELEEVDCSKSSAVKQSHEGSTYYEESQEMEVQIEIIRIGKREFLLKFIHSRKQAGFLRLMEAIHSLDHQVVDINVTTCNGKVMNILKIEVNQEETEPNDLKDSFLTIWTSKSDVNMHEEKKVKVM